VDERRYIMSVIKKTAKSAFIIMMFTMVSKFLGFVREMMIASRFGAGAVNDAYVIATTATVVIMAAVGTGLNTTLIPIFTEIQQKHGQESKIKFMGNIVNVTIFLTLGITIFGLAFSPQIIRVIASGFKGDQFRLAVELNRIGFVMVVFMVLTFVFSGFLNSSHKFGAPAAVGVVYNVVFIIYLAFFAGTFGIGGLMVATVIAYLTQVIIQLPSARRLGYKFSKVVNFKDSYLKKALFLTGPVAIGTVVRQINLVIDRTLASGLAEGSVSALNYSERLNTLVFSLFVVTIITVIFPMLSQESEKKDIEAIKNIMGYSINSILLVTMPVMIGMIVLATPIVRLVFERGAFTPEDTVATAIALTYYSISIVAFALREVLSKVFYAFQDTVTPMINGIIAVVINCFA